MTIPVQIEVSGGHIPGGKTYMATLSAVTKDAPLPAETIRQREGAGELKFGPITYTRTGEYQYRISQNTDSAEPVSYTHLTIIGRTIKDGDVISIVRKYLVSGIMIDDELSLIHICREESSLDKIMGPVITVLRIIFSFQYPNKSAVCCSK